MSKKNFVTYQESQTFAIENNIQSSSEWRKFRKSELYPQYPENAYKNEWTTWGDFLCNGRIASNLKIFLSYEEAKLFLSTLNLSSSKEYKEWWRKEEPKNIPLNADKIYKKQNVWVSWEDFLSFNRKDIIFKQCSERWMPFEELKALVGEYNITSRSEYKQWIKRNKKQDIPYTPEDVYGKLGLWKGWDDFLSKSKSKYINGRWMPFTTLKKIIQKEEFKTMYDYLEWWKTHKIPNIPRGVQNVYSEEWQGWDDFLGYKRFVTYNEAVEILKTKSIKNCSEFKKWVCDNKYLHIPSYPNKIYKDEWISWEVFLSSPYKSPNTFIFLPFNEARAYVRKLNLKSQKEWRKYRKTHSITNIPAEANITYKNDGWEGWSDFLGNGKLNHSKKLSYFEAKEYLKQFNFKKYDDFLKWYDDIKCDFICKNPHSYKDFKSMQDFLGYEDNFMPYEEFKNIIQNLGLQTSRDYTLWWNEKQPNRIPSSPDITYKNKGWTTWSDLLGTFNIASTKAREYKYNLLNEFVDEFRLRDFLMTNDENLIYIILRNIEKIDPKFNPIINDIDRVLRSGSTNPIEDLEDKYRTIDEDVTVDTVVGEINTTNIDDIDLDDDDAVEAFINNTTTTVEKTEPTIEDLTMARENEINLINTIEHMLTPEDRQFIKDKFLNDKRRKWMMERDKK